MASEADHRPDLRLGLALGIVVLGGVLGPALWASSVRERLPDEVVRHWGPDGLPTATWAPSTQLWFLAAVTILVAGGCGAVAVVGRLPLLARRILAGTAAFTATLLATLQVGGLATQLDLDDAMLAGSSGPVLLGGMLAGLVVGAAVGALAREAPHTALAAGPPPADKPRLDDEVRAWRSEAMTSRALAWVGVGILVVFTAVSIPVGIGGAQLGFLLFGLLLCGLVLATARVRTEIGPDGLTVRAPGFTVLRVPIGQVAHADVVAHVDPFWEFGGWGLRVDVHGRTGVVSRKGEALRVVRGDGSEVIVTVDGAARAAATLNSLADAHHAGR